MISKTDLGIRIRDIRKQSGLTLKELETLSGFSATHISEIERGKTSPTIGALVRIAKALGKDTSYFLEEEQLSEVAIVRAADRKRLPVEAAGVQGEYLTPGIPGGRLNAYMVHLGSGDTVGTEFPGHPGEEAVYVIQGKVELKVGERVYGLDPGDAVHYPSDQVHAIRNLGGEDARVLFVSTKRLRRNNSYVGNTGRVF
jgi:transcriptional regulator with XRE-family HTH domain